MKILIDEVKLNLLLEQKKNFIGKTVTWDSTISAISFVISVIFASYKKVWIIPGTVFKTIFLIIGIAFSIKVFYDIFKSKKNSYNYQDLLTDINKLNEITHNHSIIAIRDEFNSHSNRFLVYNDTKWSCLLFPNYKENENNEKFIIDHLSRDLKLNPDTISLKYVASNHSKKESANSGIEKFYNHRLYSVTLSEYPEFMKHDVFVCDGKTYQWKSISELENDPVAMKKNSDIIDFVKKNI